MPAETRLRASALACVAAGALLCALGSCGQRPSSEAPRHAAPADRANVAAPKPKPSVTDESTQSGLRARAALEFETRGVLDRAAEAWLESHQIEANADRLWHAATLFEETLDSERARSSYEALLQFDEHTDVVRAALRRLDALQPPDEKAAQKLVQRARTLLAEGRRSSALAMLENEGPARNDRDVLSLLGTLYWQRGQRARAQRSWAKARAQSALRLQTTELISLPAFSGAPENFVFARETLWLASEGGELFRYDPNLRFFEASSDTLDDFARLGFRHRPLALLTLPDATPASVLGDPKGVVLSKDEKVLVCLERSGRLSRLEVQDFGKLGVVWATQTDYRPLSHVPGGGPSPGLAVAHDGRYVFLGGQDGSVRGFDSAGKQVMRIDAHDHPVYHLAVSDDAHLLATTTGLRRKVVVWKVPKGERVAEFDLPEYADGLAFFPDSESLEVVIDAELWRFAWRTGKQVFRYRKPPRHELLRVAHSQSRRFTALGHHATISLSLLEGSESTVFPLTTSQSYRTWAARSSDLGHLAVGSRSGVYHVSLDPWRVKKLTSAQAEGLAISRDGQLVSVSQNLKLSVYRADGGPPVFEAPIGKLHASHMAFVWDDDLLVTGMAGATVHRLPGGEVALRARRALAYHELADGALRLRDETLERLDATGKVVESLAVASPSIAVNRAKTHFSYTSEDRDWVVRSVDGSESKSIRAPSDQLLSALSDDASTVAAVLRPARIVVFGLENRRFRVISERAHRYGPGVGGLVFFGNDWLLSWGSDGLLAHHVREERAHGGFHPLREGGWFSLAHVDVPTRVDGSALGIDAVASAAEGHSPGLVWEGLRQKGSFGRMLMNTLPGEH